MAPRKKIAPTDPDVESTSEAISEEISLNADQIIERCATGADIIELYNEVLQTHDIELMRVLVSNSSIPDNYLIRVYRADPTSISDVQKQTLLAESASDNAELYMELAAGRKMEPGEKQFYLTHAIKGRNSAIIQMLLMSTKYLDSSDISALGRTQEPRQTWAHVVPSKYSPVDFVSTRTKPLKNNIIDMAVIANAYNSYKNSYELYDPGNVNLGCVLRQRYKVYDDKCVGLIMR